MLGLSNQFYANPEEYCHEVMKQMLANETQKAMRQSAMESSALKAFLNQGQMVFCVPCGGSIGPLAPHVGQFSMPNYQPFTQPCMPMNLGTSMPPQTMLQPHHHHHQQQQQQLQQPPQPQSHQQPPPPQQQQQQQQQQQHPQQSTLQINFRNQIAKPQPIKQGADECVLGAEEIEITVDLRGYTPAEILVNIDDDRIDLKANHTDEQGNRSFSRRYDLPACIVVELTKCTLNSDGFLLISAPWKRSMDTS